MKRRTRSRSASLSPSQSRAFPVYVSLAISIETGTPSSRRFIHQRVLCADRKKTVGDQLAALPCPIGRRSTAEEQAHALLFLNCSEASYLVGCEFFNDGGSTAVMNASIAEAMAGAS